jgi:hypothetical protein
MLPDPILHCKGRTNENPTKMSGSAFYVFPEMKLLFPKQNYNILSPSSYTHKICERFIYFKDRSVYSAAGKYVDRPWEYMNRSQTHECGSTEAAQFPEKEHITGIFFAVCGLVFIEKLSTEQ